MITTAHAHKSGVIFHFFPRAFKQKKIKALRPKMTKIASRGGGPALSWRLPGKWHASLGKSVHFFCHRALPNETYKIATEGGNPSEKWQRNEIHNNTGEVGNAAESGNVFTDILAGFTFNNRVLRLPALIVLLTRRFDPETRAFFGYTSKLSNRPIYTFMLLCLGVATYRAKIVLKKC